MVRHRDLWDRCFDLIGAGRIGEAEGLLRGLDGLGPEDDDGAWRPYDLSRDRRPDGGHEPARRPSPRARLALAECLARTGQPEGAGHLLRDLSNDGDCPDDLLPAVAAALGQLGESAAALGACVELARRRPELAEAHFGVAFYLRRLGRSAETVLPVVARAHELAPEVPLYRISLATLLDHVGRRDEAREILRDLDLDAVSCRGCLRRMSTIFRDRDRG